MTTSVQDQSPAVQAMALNWPIVEALLGGTPAMRAKGETYLPRWPNEAPEAFKARLAAATLYPALRRTLSVMAGKPFSKALTFSDNVPPDLKAWCANADLEGRNLHAFGAGLMSEALAFGLCGVYVDMPRSGAAARLANGAVTRKAEAEAGARPYLIAVKHHQILGWRVERKADRVRLTQLRIAEVDEVEDGEYGVKEVRRVRVLTPGAWELWQQWANEADRSASYTLVDQGVTTLGYIPFVPFYGEYHGFMNGRSPLLDLAHLNVKHWQSQSDQDTILHVARVPILAASGIDDDSPITIGASSAVKLPTGAALTFVEHTGAAISAGAQSLRELEQQMIQTGAELLIQSAANRTATEASNEAEGNKSELLRIVEGFEDSLDQVLQCMADYAGQGDGGNVSLFKDFTAATLTDASASLVLDMQGRGLLTKPTALREMQRRGTVAPDVDPETEIELAEAEAPVTPKTPGGEE